MPGADRQCQCCRDVKEVGTKMYFLTCQLCECWQERQPCELSGFVNAVKLVCFWVRFLRKIIKYWRQSGHLYYILIDCAYYNNAALILCFRLLWLDGQVVYTKKSVFLQQEVTTFTVWYIMLQGNECQLSVLLFNKA